jgi:integrase
MNNDPAFREFITSLHAKATRDYYIFSLKRYMKFLCVRQPKELVAKDVRLIQSDIVRYIVEDKSVLPATMRGYVAVLKKFYVQNDVIGINWTKVTSKIPQPNTVRNDRPYTTDEINVLLDNSDRRQKVMILLMASTGMRVGALPGLKMRHLKRIARRNLEFYQLTVYAGEREQYQVPCTPECAEAIDDYLKHRASMGETICPDTPIIREQFDTEDLFMIKHPRQIKESSAARMIHDLVRKSGSRQRKTIPVGQQHGRIRHDVHACHGFRKWFVTTLMDTAIKSDYIEMWQGHKTWQRTAYVYNELTEQYLNAIPHLTIRETNRLASKVKEKEKEIARYADIIDAKYNNLVNYFIKNQEDKEKKARNSENPFFRLITRQHCSDDCRDCAGHWIDKDNEIEIVCLHSCHPKNVEYLGGAFTDDEGTYSLKPGHSIQVYVPEQVPKKVSLTSRDL